MAAVRHFLTRHGRGLVVWLPLLWLVVFFALPLVEVAHCLGSTALSLLRLPLHPLMRQLPEEHLERALETRALQGNGTFIVKPLNSSRGRGIFVTDDIDSLEADAKLLVQEYIDPPLLLQQLCLQRQFSFASMNVEMCPVRRASSSLSHGPDWQLTCW